MEEETYKLKYSDEYLDHIEKHLKSGQKKLLIKINSLLDELETHPTTGTGQVEPLKGYGERNVYSRRINQKHRLTYEVFDEGKNVLVLRMRNVPAMDISGLEALEELLKLCKKRGINLILSHVNEQPMKVMEKAGFIEKIGRENCCDNIDKSLERAESLKISRSC